ncbi:MAG: hypothetical protein NWF04_04750 [Candidatus Bathyarchaeota archaeon]|nr:hypothetical protein [Candidatus Bathyarchaeota archaeon]
MEESYVQTLVGLGLTSCQSRVYLELVRLAKPSAAKTISSASKVTRQDIYRIMPALQRLGLIETILGSPTTFQAVPIHEVIPILMERQKQHHSKLHQKATQMLQHFENTPENGHQKDDHYFMIIPQKEASLKRRKQTIENAKKTFHVISSKRRVFHASFHLHEELIKAAKRGVKIRIITEKPHETDNYPKEHRLLLKHQNVQIRYLPEPPKAVLTISDHNEASLLTHPTSHWTQSNALWTNNPSFIAILQDHFKNTWDNVTPE